MEHLAMSIALLAVVAVIIGLNAWIAGSALANLR